MPQRRGNRYKKKLRKKNYRQKNTLVSTVLVNRGASFMPDVFRTKLKYTDRIVLSTASGAVNHTVFRGNSIFDPDFTGTGHQPAGFDELAAIYDVYKVYASSIRVRYISTVQTAGSVMEISLIPNANGATEYDLIDPETVNEQPYGKMILVAGDASSSKFSINSYMTSAQMMSKGRVAGAIETGAIVVANPSFQWFWNINTQVVDQSTTQSGFLYVSITYFTEFSFRKMLAES